jgi:PKD domain
MMIRRLKYSVSCCMIFAVLLLPGQACWGALFNQAPVISELSAGKKLVVPLEQVQLRCVAVDRDRDPLKYEWSAEGGKIEGSGSAVTWKAPEKPGVYTVKVRVNDGKGGKAESQVIVQVLSKSNNPPIIEELSARPKVIFKEKSTTLVCEAMDPDGDALTYHWEAKAGRLVGEGGRIIWFAPNDEQDFVITCTVTDSKGNKSRPATVTVKVICDCEGPGRTEE